MRMQDIRMLPIYFHTAILLTLLPQWILSSAVPPGRTETYLKSFSLTHAVRGSEGSSGHWRSKRSLPLDELTFLVDDHNAKRRLEPSSDMEHMKWNAELASMAQDWAQRCEWGHGQPPRNNPPFPQIGQNLYAHKPGLNLTLGMLEWSDYEKVYYNYNTGGCRKEPCGHYTQVVWSTSNEVGCAYHLCPNLVNAFTNAWYLVCNYGPAGNYRGQKPFALGQPCTQCTSGEFWCDNKLCRRDCWASDANCYCGAQCANGGCITSNCKCQCQDGYTGPNCAAPCQDTHEYCNANPGWPKSWCQHERWGADVRKGCPLMCDICKAYSGNTFQCPAVNIVTVPPRSTAARPTIPGIKGVIIVTSSMQIYWDRIWDSLRPVVTSALTNYCNDRPAECCNGQTPQGDDGFIFDVNNVRQGLGFPRYGKYSGEDSTELLFYAQSRTVRGQCQNYLPQPVLLAALNGVRAQLNQAVGVCCDSILYALTLGQEPPSSRPVFTTPTRPPPTPTNAPQQGLGPYQFPTWAIVFIVVLLLGVAVVGLVGGLYWTRKLREERRSSPRARRSSPPEIQTSTLEKAVTFSPPKSPKKSPKSPKSILKKTNNTSDKSKKSQKNNKSDKSKKPEKNTDNNKEGVNPEGIVQERILGFDNAAYYNY